MTSNHYYLAVFSFLVGIFVATIFSISLATLIWLMGGALISALLRSRYNQGGHKIFYLVAGLSLAFFVLGAVRLNIALETFGDSRLVELVGQNIEFTGVVVREVEVREKVKYLYVRSKDDLLLVSTDRYTSVAYGDVVIASGKLTKPEAFTTEFGRIFNYSGYLLAKGVEYKMAFADVTVIEKDAGHFLIAYLLKFKSAFLNQISALLPEPAAGLGAGLLLGVKQALGEELETAFRETGIIHIVVLSGYNVMLVVIFIMYILRSFLPLRPRVVIGLLAIMAFAFLVGLSATVIRACLMASLLLFSQLTGRTYLVLRGLLLAATLMLIFNPLLLVYDVGFQLSFMATLGLILIAPLIERWFRFRLKPGRLDWRGFLVATLATQIAVLPLLLYQIGQFSIISVVVNVLVLPMVPVAMSLTFATGLVAFLSPDLASLLSLPTYFSLSYINYLALWFAKLPFASVVIPVFPFYIVPLAYAVLGYFLFRQQRLVDQLGVSGRDLVAMGSKADAKVELALSEWTIEEEFDKSSPVKNLPQVKRNEPESNTPIFFR